ncbi:tRNA (N(6)-L-threonylcarbamoyladenosine(37)-C(2))-methylthiotransferase MtaB [Butyrivibrio sp. CB08]|uniref:tRNA (N(6)-L-threonylcarbamoyladenosine(37)-C(2))- methylthiotransferase MtaB n=1 Tax=Butyrivibrio sp. CB08 TaxID=2364879 RepID=UPI000EA841B7|nr:tRNA (N(6)-L-threonylcarbamoyladenosine(37)-C(2))-methylthiotransferase MtaB [Butyrivibrio sp. CB08]RKM59904.1 tRNA (N(6)-L-threonylcarbamoyladenosine(37)-C(2))-methylthiotransferase MtaB [Butyrivibrio sp. CB08]
MENNIKGLKVALHNLGCKVNSYEMDVMIQKLVDAGCIIVPFNEKADVYIINTCTVTNIADRKSRQMLHRSKKENPDAIVVAVGCYVETGIEGVKKDEAIDLAIGNNKKSEIASILDEFVAARGDYDDKTMGGKSMIDINHTDIYEEMKLTNLPEHTRAYIKVQDGCNQFCTYCVIPYARGRVRSREMEDVLTEITDLSGKGCKEVVITGIHVGSYGVDKGQPMLVDLVEKVAEIPGIERIRLGSIEPRFITKENVDRMAKIDKLCPHFHLSLQSGCNSVLKRMNRHYSAEEFKESVALLRKAFDRPAITTDVIVGFPGETEEEFIECRDFVSDIEFYEMHVFKYSPRKGTVAAGMADQLTDREKSARSDVLLDITDRDSQNYRKGFIGQELSVLWEDEEVHGGKTYMIGHTDRYVRVAACEGTKEYEKAVSGELSRVTPRAMLSPDTLLI